MRRGITLFALVNLLLACLGLLACQTGPSEEEVKAAKSAEDWAWLEQAKAELDGKRAEAMELQEQIATWDPDAEPAAAEAGTEAEEGTEGEGAESSEEAPATLDDIKAQAEAAAKEAVNLADTFSGRLIQFINDEQIGVDSEPTAIQRQALAMKSDEDIVLAEEYISRGGEYQRAIDIYTQALVFDPDNEKLQAAKSLAEERRYMTEERLAEVKKGMTQEEVRALLGTPKGSNVREYDNGGVGWFFPKEVPHTASAVFFQKKKDQLVVYKTDFNAIKAES